MRRTSKIALAIGVPLGLLASAGHAAVAATTPGSHRVSAAVPIELVTLTDDTGTITVGVPSSWTDVDTSPYEGAPYIGASPDLEAYLSTFSVPGVEFLAGPFTPDTETAARRYGVTDGCATEALVPYDDGVFAGSHLLQTGCGATAQSDFHVVAANPSDQAFTAVLVIQVNGPDRAPIVDHILATFDATGEPAAPPDDPVLGLLQHQVQELFGVTLTPEQGRCLLDHAGELDPTNRPATLTLILDCGVDMMDIKSGLAAVTGAGS